MGSRSDKADAVFFPGVVIVAFEVLAVGSDVHKEDGAIKAVTGMFLGNDRLLDGVHTANR